MYMHCLLPPTMYITCPVLFPRQRCHELSAQELLAKRRNIAAWQWTNMRGINSAEWRSEDAEWIKKYLEREERGMLSSATSYSGTVQT